MRLGAERGFPTGLVLGAAAMGAAVLVGALHLDQLPVTLCLFKRITGLPCMTCGSTRAFAQLYHHDLFGALVMNPLATLGAFLVGLWFLADLVLVWRGRALALDLTAGESRVISLLAMAALIVNWGYVIAAGR